MTHTGPAEVGNRPPHAELVAAARRVRANAHAPWSGFAVGAALATTSGAVFCGVNVESVALPAGVCAERGALAAAVAGGHRDFAVLAGAGPGAQPSPPCGVCRQALAEFDGEGLLARILLHELDHLNGILLIDHLARHDRKDAMRRIRAGELERPPEAAEREGGTDGEPEGGRRAGMAPETIAARQQAALGEQRAASPPA